MKMLLSAFLVWLIAAPWLLFPQWFPLLSILFLLLLMGSRLGLAWRWQRIVAASPLNAFVLVYLLLAGGAFLMAPFPQQVIPKLTTLILGIFGYLLVLDWLCPPTDVDRQIKEGFGDLPAGLVYLVFFLAMSGGLIALGSVFAVEWPQRQLWDTAFITGHIPHLTGSFTIHANEVAGTLLFLIPFTLLLARWPAGSYSPFAILPDSRKLKGLGWFLFSIMLLVILLMQSRVALLALPAVILVYFVWGRWRLRWLVVTGVAGGSLLLLAGILFKVTPEQITTWVSTVDAVSKQGPLAPQSWPMRQEIWSAAGQVLVDYPVFGIGLDSLVPVSRANYPFFAIPVDLDFEHAHNLWLQAGADMGWPGLVATLLLLIVPLWGLWLARRAEGLTMSFMTGAFGAALAGYILFNMLDTISPLQRPGIFLWLILAASAAILQRTGVFDRRVEYSALAPLILLAVLIFTPLLGRNRANWQFDQARLTGRPLPDHGDLTGRRQCVWWAHQQKWADAESCFTNMPDDLLFLQSQGQRAASALQLEEALAWYNMALRLDQEAASVYYWRGQLYEDQQAYAQAQRDYEQAVRFAERQGLSKPWQANFHFHLGRAYVHTKSWESALQYFQTAVELDETQPLYFKALGDVLLVFGDKKGAEEAYKRAGE